MLTSSSWVDFGLHNGAKGKVVDFVYKHADGPQINNGKALIEGVVVQFHSKGEGVEPFIEGVPNTVAIEFFSAEWKIRTKYSICKQFPLVLLWTFTIHKAQDKNLDLATIDIDKSERCCGMTLVALSRVHKLEHFLLKPFTLEQLQKITRSNSLATIQTDLQTLNANFQSTKVILNHLWNE